MVKIRVIEMEGDGAELASVLDRLRGIATGGTDTLSLPAAPEAVLDIQPATMAEQEEPIIEAVAEPEAPRPKARTRKVRSPTRTAKKGATTNTCKTCFHPYASAEHKEKCAGRRKPRASASQTTATT